MMRILTFFVLVSFTRFFASSGDYAIPALIKYGITAVAAGNTVLGLWPSN